MEAFLEEHLPKSRMERIKKYNIVFMDMLSGRSDFIPEIQQNDYEVCLFAFGMTRKACQGVIRWQYESSSTWSEKGCWMETDWEFSA